ncbi:MAG: MFS transporter [Anaerolineales bacterium]|nr:MFS transporter [Anaerolineales bacterium]
MLDKFKNTIHEYPRSFWVLISATFIDRLGGTMIYPFFALYITQKFQVGMTEAGVLFGIFAVSGFIGSIIGGALADKYGRRSIMLFGLIFSALSSLSMGFVSQLSVFYLLAAIVGLLSDIGGPARQAMVADLLPREQQSEGFSFLRVTGNLAWILGPTIGGLLAVNSYLPLFILDAITSAITALIVYRSIQETKPESTSDQDQKSVLDTMAGYRTVGADRLYMAYLLVSILMLLVYVQMYNTLSVYLRDVHGITAREYGLLLSLDAGMVVVCQFWVSRRVKKYSPMIMMALGNTFYMVGFTLFGIVDTYLLFIVTILIITVGEMIVMPVGQALAAQFAPSDMRGRYLAIYGLAYTIPNAIGPSLAGLVLDNFNPDWVWYGAGMVSLVAIMGFLALQRPARARFATEQQPLERI